MLALVTGKSCLAPVSGDLGLQGAYEFYTESKCRRKVGEMKLPRLFLRCCFKVKSGSHRKGKIGRGYLAEGDKVKNYRKSEIGMETLLLGSPHEDKRSREMSGLITISWSLSTNQELIDHRGTEITTFFLPDHSDKRVRRNIAVMFSRSPFERYFRDCTAFRTE